MSLFFIFFWRDGQCPYKDGWGGVGVLLCQWVHWTKLRAAEEKSWEMGTKWYTFFILPVFSEWHQTKLSYWKDVACSQHAVSHEEHEPGRQGCGCGADLVAYLDVWVILYVGWARCICISLLKVSWGLGWAYKRSSSLMLHGADIFHKKNTH